MGRIFTCLAIACVMAYIAPTYGTECYESQNQTYWDCILNFAADGPIEAEEVPCQWMQSNDDYHLSKGTCTKPCHLRSSETECKNYGGGTGHDFCVWSNNGGCIPNCGTITKGENCDRTVGCVYDEGRESCGRCQMGKYYKSNMLRSQLIQVDLEGGSYQNRYADVVGRGTCTRCEDSGVKLPDGVKWLPGVIGGIGKCAWEIKCPVGRGLVTEYECGSCPQGKTSSEKTITFIPNGGENQTINECNDVCPAGYYCDGENGQQPCPKAENATVGMTSNSGAISKEQCYITKDTEFCDRHGCFSLPLGNATLTYWKSTK